MPKIKAWQCDRCGATRTSYPWSVAVVQVDPETGEPTQLEKLSRRYKDASQKSLCKSCADDVVSMVMGIDDIEHPTHYDRIMACENADDLAHYLCDMFGECGECPVRGMCKADSHGKNGFFRWLVKEDK